MKVSEEIIKWAGQVSLLESEIEEYAQDCSILNYSLDLSSSFEDARSMADGLSTFQDVVNSWSLISDLWNSIKGDIFEKYDKIIKNLPEKTPEHIRELILEKQQILTSGKFEDLKQKSEALEQKFSQLQNSTAELERKVNQYTGRMEFSLSIKLSREKNALFNSDYVIGVSSEAHVCFARQQIKTVCSKVLEAASQASYTQYSLNGYCKHERFGMFKDKYVIKDGIILPKNTRSVDILLYSGEDSERLDVIRINGIVQLSTTLLMNSGFGGLVIEKVSPIIDALADIYAGKNQKQAYALSH